jgi:hypothetical protein
MTRCPRCDSEVERLHPIPAEALANGPGGGPSDGTAEGSAEACRWCINEISEG